MTTLYIDVSHHDWNRRGGNLDWAATRAATSSVMCARATYGDPNGFNRPTYHFADFQQGAAGAGFTARGGYHNLVRGDSASMRRQVDWFRRTLDSQSCGWAMVDVERYKELLETGNQPGWDDVRRWQDAWYAVDSRPMAWYLPRWVWSYWSYADLRELRGPLIQSHYLTGVYGSPWDIYNAGGGDSGTGWDDFYGNRYPDIWQYSATCTVPGASDQTDVNAFRGTVDQLRAILTGDDMELSDPLGRYPGKDVDSALSDVLKTVNWLWSAADGSGDQVPEFDLAPSSRLGMMLEAARRPPVELTDEQLATFAEQVGGKLEAGIAAALKDPAVLAAIAAAVGRLEAAADKARAEVLDGPDQAG